jgi:hypothetical protein
MAFSRLPNDKKGKALGTRLKKGILNFFHENVGDGRRGGEVILKKFSGYTQKIFPIYHIFS